MAVRRLHISKACVKMIHFISQSNGVNFYGGLSLVRFDRSRSCKGTLFHGPICLEQQPYHKRLLLLLGLNYHKDLFSKKAPLRAHGGSVHCNVLFAPKKLEPRRAATNSGSVL